mgnify:CR=1 FL=1
MAAASPTWLSSAGTDSRMNFPLAGVFAVISVTRSGWRENKVSWMDCLSASRMLPVARGSAFGFGGVAGIAFSLRR